MFPLVVNVSVSVICFQRPTWKPAFVVCGMRCKIKFYVMLCNLSLRAWMGGGGVGVTANTKILGNLTANSKKFTVTVKIHK